MSSRLSSAALRPLFGSQPAPRPLVSLTPICTFTGDVDFFKACESVLTAINSTPDKLSLIICCSELPPPPPIPRIRITLWHLLSPVVLISSEPGVSSTRKSLIFLLSDKIFQSIIQTFCYSSRSAQCLKKLRTFLSGLLLSPSSASFFEN